VVIFSNNNIMGRTSGRIMEDLKQSNNFFFGGGGGYIERSLDTDEMSSFDVFSERNKPTW